VAELEADGEELELHEATGPADLALACTVSVWLPDPWPEECGVPTYRYFRTVWETGYEATSGSGDHMLSVTCASGRSRPADPRESPVSGTHFPTFQRPDGPTYFFRIEPGSGSVIVRIRGVSQVRAEEIVSQLRSAPE
jgi:hypothetical protein